MLIELVLPPEPSSKITGFSVYRLYLMVKGHFNGKYDIPKYSWKMNVSPKTYEKRRDKYFFERLSAKYNLGELYRILVSNMLANSNAWVGDISGADALQFYREYCGKLERASYLYKEDLENLLYFCQKKSIMFKDLFDCSKGQPLIFKMLQQELVSYETFLLINASGNFVDKFDVAMKDDIVWMEYRKRIHGYNKIVRINSVEAKEILISVLRK